MRKVLFALILVLGFMLASGVAMAGTVYVDEVVLFDQPAGSSNEGGPVSKALGAPDGSYVSVDIPETLILAFTDNTAYDGEGYDLKLYEVSNGDSDVDVYASKDGITWVFLGLTDGTVSYDFALVGLEYANFVKIVGLQNGGMAEGYDLDAVEALNSGDYFAAVPIPAAFWLLGSGLVGLISLRKKIAR